MQVEEIGETFAGGWDSGYSCRDEGIGNGSTSAAELISTATADTVGDRGGVSEEIPGGGGDGEQRCQGTRVWEEEGLKEDSRNEDDEAGQDHVSCLQAFGVRRVGKDVAAVAIGRVEWGQGHCFHDDGVAHARGAKFDVLRSRMRRNGDTWLALTLIEVRGGRRRRTVRGVEGGEAERGHLKGMHVPQCGKRLERGKGLACAVVVEGVDADADVLAGDCNNNLAVAVLIGV